MAFLKASVFIVCPSPTAPKSVKVNVRSGIVGSAGLTFSAEEVSTPGASDRVETQDVVKVRARHARIVDTVRVRFMGLQG